MMCDSGFFFNGSFVLRWSLERFCEFLWRVGDLGCRCSGVERGDMASELADDLLELRQLLGEAKRPRIQALLSNEIAVLEKVLLVVKLSCIWKLGVQRMVAIMMVDLVGVRLKPNFETKTGW